MNTATPAGRMRVLIGFDGSDGAHDALADLGRSGLPGSAQAMVICAADIPVSIPYQLIPGEAGGVIAESVLAEVRQATERENQRAATVASAGAELLSKSCPGWEVETCTAAEPAYVALIEQAQRWSADLIVIGSHGRSSLARWVFGSVSEKVLAHAICSVRIGRVDPSVQRRTDSPVRILLGVDGSPEASVAARIACEREWPAGSAIRVATVVDPRLSLGLTRLLRGGGERASPVQAMVQSMADRLREGTVEVTSVLLEGDPKQLLLHEATQWGADCIFLGARGHSRLKRFLIGSVSAAVAARARCSVEVVRSAERA